MNELNQKVDENVALRRKQAVLRVMLVWIAAGAVMLTCIGLDKIEFISREFMWILISCAALAGAFRSGYIWHDAKF